MARVARLAAGARFSGRTQSQSQPQSQSQSQPQPQPQPQGTAAAARVCTPAGTVAGKTKASATVRSRVNGLSGALFPDHDDDDDDDTSDASDASDGQGKKRRKDQVQGRHRCRPSCFGRGEPCPSGAFANASEDLKLSEIF